MILALLLGTLILNSENTPCLLPRHFRIEESLKASGSGQFSENGLRAILEKIPPGHEIVIVDLRQESHGFANGTAVSWFTPQDAANLGKTLAEIQEDEEAKLKALPKEIVVQRIISKPQDVIEKSEELRMVVERVATEKQLTETFNLGYLRIPVTDHRAPTQDQVERFLQFVRTLSPNSWLHFHCEAGEGRTTTFLVLYDILKNGKSEGLETIIDRQHKAGGMALFEMPDRMSWKYPYAEERKQFIQKFYSLTTKNN